VRVLKNNHSLGGFEGGAGVCEGVEGQSLGGRFRGSDACVRDLRNVTGRAISREGEMCEGVER
jgi:hypothetical protein